MIATRESSCPGPVGGFRHAGLPDSREFVYPCGIEREEFDES